MLAAPGVGHNEDQLLLCIEASRTWLIVAHVALADLAFEVPKVLMVCG